MDFIPSENDYRIINQKSRVRYARLKLYDEKLVFLGEIQGEVIGGSINIDSSSDIRRTCSLDVQVKDDSYKISINSKVWITRILNIEVGELDLANDEIKYYQAGVFTFDNTAYTYSETSNTLSLSCSDLMTFLTEARGSHLPSQSTQILYDDYGYDYWYYYFLTEGKTEEEANTLATDKVAEPPATLNEIIIDTLNQLTFINGRYHVENIYDVETGNLATVPYDLSFPAGATVYDILAKIKELHPGWEMFFDRYGYFIYRKIPDFNSESYFIEANRIHQLVISETLNRNFNDICNCTFIWGSQIETDAFISRETASVTDGVFVLTEPATLSVSGGEKFGFVAPENSIQGQTIQLKNTAGDEVLPVYPIKTYINNQSLCNIPEGYLVKGESYVIKLVITPNETDRYYYLYGQYQVHGEFEEHNIYATPFVLDNMYVVDVDKHEFIERQICDQYEATVSGAIKQFTFVKKEYHLVNGTKIIFSPTVASVSNQKLRVRLFDGGETTKYRDFVLLNREYNNISQNELSSGVEYVFQLFHGVLILQGTSKKIENSNIPVIDLSNPFSVEKIGRIIQTFADGEYSNIGNDELANQRAEYQTNLSIHFNDQIDLSMILIPWIDVNQKISHTSLNTNKTNDYIITNTNFSFSSGQMSLSLSRLYNTFI